MTRYTKKDQYSTGTISTTNQFSVAICPLGTARWCTEMNSVTRVEAYSLYPMWSDDLFAFLRNFAKNSKRFARGNVKFSSSSDASGIVIYYCMKIWY